MQFGQRYVEEQDDKTVTEWMRKQVRSPALQAILFCNVGMRQAGLPRDMLLGCWPFPGIRLCCCWKLPLTLYHLCLLQA